MSTGNAVEYLRALARCWPPHPVDSLYGARRTRKYSIKHWRNHIKLGTPIINGTSTVPPQLRSGRCVDEPSAEKNMHRVMKRSPKTLAYDVNTSANRISPNLPSCGSASPPKLTRRKVAKNLLLPPLGRFLNGTTNIAIKAVRYVNGIHPKATTRSGMPHVQTQKSDTDNANNAESAIARRYVEP